mmetsp:Transcript_8878/g.19208  ORF Transcript_8878/g.19208 Transcript_8878/m.19208 type:complete len:206 (+) Transcript_8878:579-1196(+)
MPVSLRNRDAMCSMGTMLSRTFLTASLLLPSFSLVWSERVRAYPRSSDTAPSSRAAHSRRAWFVSSFSDSLLGVLRTCRFIVEGTPFLVRFRGRRSSSSGTSSSTGGGSRGGRCSSLATMTTSWGGGGARMGTSTASGPKSPWRAFIAASIAALLVISAIVAGSGRLSVMAALCRCPDGNFRSIRTFFTTTMLLTTAILSLSFTL